MMNDAVESFVVGVWTNQVLKDMQNKVIGVMPDMKMVLYSAVCSVASKLNVMHFCFFSL